jgi:hypothetical protein
LTIDFHTHIFPPWLKDQRDRWLGRDSTFGALYSDPKAKIAAVNVLFTEAGLHVMEAARARKVQRIADELSFLTQEELEVVLKAAELLEESEARTQSKTL